MRHVKRSSGVACNNNTRLGNATWHALRVHGQKAPHTTTQSTPHAANKTQGRRAAKCLPVTSARARAAGRPCKGRKDHRNTTRTHATQPQACIVLRPLSTVASASAALTLHRQRRKAPHSTMHGARKARTQYAGAWPPLTRGHRQRRVCQHKPGLGVDVKIVGDLLAEQQRASLRWEQKGGGWVMPAAFEPKPALQQ